MGNPVEEQRKFYRHTNKTTAVRTESMGLQTKLDYNGGTNPVYIGKAASGTLTSDPGWQIRKLTYDINGNVTDLGFGNGTDNYTNIWDNRISLTYT